MTMRPQKTANGPENKKGASAPHAGHDEACRCAETSKMTPQELFKLVLSDLAFWKKAKKG